MHVALYARVSTTRQADNDLSPINSDSLKSGQQPTVTWSCMSTLNRVHLLPMINVPCSSK